jgi:3-hydroxybutyryl-CoA dehydrogenase
VTEAEALPDIATVGIVGAGAMGAGFAQMALEAGREVVLYDVDPTAVERARDRIGDGLRRRWRELDDADRAERVDAALGRLRDATTLVELATDTDLVLEAALEDLELKQTIFRALDAEADARVILATNTSALSVAAIASATSRPERVIGLHGFNPVPLMALVEVVTTDATDPDIRDRATAEVRAWGKTPIVCADTPGFIVNRVNRPYTIEALRLLEAGNASVAAIDEALRAAGYPMGPFELMDLAGLDVNLAAATAVWEGLGRPDRLRPSPIQERLVAEGHLGRKTGQGFYRYDDDGRRAAVASEFESTADAGADTGLVLTRILDAVTAEAELAVAAGVASAEDIDSALRLGARHPVGPLERRGDRDADGSSA